MFYKEVNDLYLNQLLDDFEATLAEGKHTTLLNKFVDIRKEIESYQTDMLEELEHLDEMLIDIQEVFK